MFGKAEKKNKDNTIIILGCILAFGLFVAATYNVWLTTHDDIVYYMNTRLGNIFQRGLADAKATGRFYFIYSELIYSIPYLFNNLIWFKIVEYTAIIFSVYGMWKLFAEHVDRTMAFLLVMLFWGLAQIDLQHNVFVSYPFHHQIGMGFIFLSLSSYVDYLKEKKKKSLIVSSLLYAVPLFLYEAYICFSVVYFLLGFVMKYKELNSVKAILKNIAKVLVDLRYHILISILFLFCYVGFQVVYPVTYGGAGIYISSLRDIVKTILVLGTGLFPLNVWHKSFASLNSIQALLHSGVVNIGISLFLGIVFAKSLDRMKNVPKGVLCILFLCSCFGIFLPCIPYGLTQQYTEWVTKNGIYGFVPSYFSYFSLIIVLLAIVVFIYKFFLNISDRLAKIFKICSCIVVFFAIGVTGVSNERMQDIFETNLDKYEAFDTVVASKEFQDIPDNSIVYIPDYMGIHYNMNITEQYTKIYGDNIIEFVNQPEELDFSRDVYELRYYAEDGLAALAQIDENFTSENAYIYLLDQEIEKCSIYTKDEALEIDAIVSSVAELDMQVDLEKIDFEITKESSSEIEKKLGMFFWGQ